MSARILAPTGPGQLSSKKQSEKNGRIASAVYCDVVKGVKKRWERVERWEGSRDFESFAKAKGMDDSRSEVKRAGSVSDCRPGPRWFQLRCGVRIDVPER